MLSKEFGEMKMEIKAAMKEFDTTCHIINEITEKHLNLTD